jgi:Asp-tRNA(Asn)/Glu-tRNA(Gln) amidotransferase A subunit family amidase
VSDATSRRHAPDGLVALRRGIASGALAADAVIRDGWERARRSQPALEAFAYLPERTPEPGRGPMAGIPVAIKDLIDTADMPTSYGAAIYRDHRPAADAAIVARLRACGATVIGKTVTTEFAYQQPGPTRNPWNRDHTPGGSSSGSAAAVAAGLVPLAFGTQTMGSVIRPAAFCGVVGFKPTFGLLPREGVYPLCDALDHVGLFARSADDIADALEILQVLPAGTAPEPRTLRLGVLPIDDPVISSAQRETFRAAVDIIRGAGHGVAEAQAPEGLAAVPGIVDRLLSFDVSRHFGPLVAQHGTAIGAPIRDLVARGRALEQDDHAAALSDQAAFREACRVVAEGCDALLTIPAAGEAPRGLGSTGDPRFCAPWSLAGVPALTIPVGFGPAGLPLGLQIVGHAGGDAALLRLGAALASLFPPLPMPPV